MSKGGTRPGTGRKPLAPDARRVPVCFSVSPEVRDMAQELAKSGVKTGRLVEAFIRAAYASKICLGIQETICTAITGEYLRK